MKKSLLLFGALGVLFATTSATCSPDTPEPELKNYNCKCTYVPVDTAQDVKEETTVVTGKSSGEANVNCGGLSGKYSAQLYSGSCVLQQ